MDWECTLCKEQNYAKVQVCFKCKTDRRPEARQVPPRTWSKPPTEGKTMEGMVKSYNKNGFGFIMCTGGYTQDIYFRREHVASRLLHPDMPGEQVTFEVYREGGKLVARNVRALGEPLRCGEHFGSYGGRVKGSGKGGGGGGGGGVPGGKGDDGSWICPACKEHNFSRRFMCFKCGVSRPEGLSGPGQVAAAAAPPGFSAAPPRVPGQPRFAFSDAPPPAAAAAPKRDVSPHAGARAIREQLLAARGGGAAGGSQSRSSSSEKEEETEKKGKRKASSSKSSSSSESSRKKKKKSKKKKRRRSSSSSSSEVEELKGSGSASASSAAANPEIEKAKSEAMAKLLELKKVENKEERLKLFRSLLRQWHPDKNLDKVEVATAVFQFLQKGKVLMEGA